MIITINPARAAEIDRKSLPVITARQLRLALLGLGLTAPMVEAKIATMPSAEAALIEWEYATVYERDHPLVVALGVLLEMTSEQIDDAWREAAKL